MKRLLTTTAIATMAFAGAASAQSVLERVLQQTQSLSSVTGVFANVADNIGGTTTVDVYTNATGDVLNQAQYDALVVANTVELEAPAGSGVYYNLATGEVITAQQYAQLTVAASASFTELTGNEVLGRRGDGSLQLFAAIADYNTAVTTGETAIAAFAPTTIVTGATGSIDGSITNIARRIDQATATVDGQVNAIEGVTTNFGNMSTTVLGAVNTGQIGLGTNQLVEEALSGTSQAVRSKIDQIGTLAGTTQIALNSALNTMNINGSISNTFEGVNASVAAISPDVLEIVSTNGTITLAGLDQLLGSMDTTVLGAVNTGTIVSGVNNQVGGTVAGIVGNSSTNMFAE
jgi:hypothetical protein